MSIAIHLKVLLETAFLPAWFPRSTKEAKKLYQLNTDDTVSLGKCKNEDLARFISHMIVKTGPRAGVLLIEIKNIFKYKFPATDEFFSLIVSAISAEDNSIIGWINPENSQDFYLVFHKKTLWLRPVHINVGELFGPYSATISLEQEKNAEIEFIQVYFPKNSLSEKPRFLSTCPDWLKKSKLIKEQLESIKDEF